MTIYPQIKGFYQNCMVKYGKNLDQMPWQRYVISELLFLMLSSIGCIRSDIFGIVLDAYVYLCLSSNLNK